MQIYFTRHGRTPLTGPPDRFCGLSDPSLTKEGRQDVKQLAKALVGQISPKAIYCSDLRRTKESAEIIANIMGTSIIATNTLREIGFGEWEGLTKKEVMHRYPDIYMGWSDNPLVVKPPQANCPEEVARRAEHFAKTIQTQSGPLLVVGHKTFLRISLCTWLGIDLIHYRSSFDIYPATLGSVVFSGAKCRLTLLNWQPGSHLQSKEVA